MTYEREREGERERREREKYIDCFRINGLDSSQLKYMQPMYLRIHFIKIKRVQLKKYPSVYIYSLIDIISSNDNDNVFFVNSTFVINQYTASG